MWRDDRQGWSGSFLTNPDTLTLQTHHQFHASHSVSGSLRAIWRNSECCNLGSSLGRTSIWRNMGFQYLLNLIAAIFAMIFYSTNFCTSLTPASTGCLLVLPMVLCFLFFLQGVNYVCKPNKFQWLVLVFAGQRQTSISCAMVKTGSFLLLLPF